VRLETAGYFFPVCAVARSIRTRAWSPGLVLSAAIQAQHTRLTAIGACRQGKLG
jgi:hypothetical protein